MSAKKSNALAVMIGPISKKGGPDESTADDLKDDAEEVPTRKAYAEKVLEAVAAKDADALTEALAGFVDCEDA